MGNSGLIAKNQFSMERRDPSYHLRLLGVLAVLVDAGIWQDALRIADLLDRNAAEFDPNEEDSKPGVHCRCHVRSNDDNLRADSTRSTASGEF